ncbi:hypothetical protein [Candidatus Cryosericum terrychapinii]|jgi:hypothetical protein|uniref:Uncharacterized protein n=1 Tax=Candidatus Cryosericum terrychapinii TaxID=2290919 RepID=A0A398CVP7_9BACT|nr:hypothetical protein [Candidatus Cryosericum terrychapinii]RIE06715.1 hypothetical protein SMC7_01525 [Candidatus Cryosericum terrychapinii]
MAQFACSGLKKRQILAAMFLTIFIDLLGAGVIIPATASIILILRIAAGATTTLLAWAMFMILRVYNKACADVTASP